MSLLHTISLDTLTRLIGTPACLTLIDVPTDEDFAADPRLIPGLARRPWAKAADWARFDGCSAVVISQEGLKLSQGFASVPVEVLEGGTLAWGKAALPIAPTYGALTRSLRLVRSILPLRIADGSHHSVRDSMRERRRCDHAR
jgi:hypothetical protein